MHSFALARTAINFFCWSEVCWSLPRLVSALFTTLVLTRPHSASRAALETAYLLRRHNNSINHIHRTIQLSRNFYDILYNNKISFFNSTIEEPRYIIKPSSSSSLTQHFIILLFRTTHHSQSCHTPHNPKRMLPSSTSSAALSPLR